MGYDVEGIRTKTPAEHHEKESRSLHFDRAGAKSAPQKGRQAASCIEIAIGRSNRIHLRLDWRPIRAIRRRLSPISFASPRQTFSLALHLRLARTTNARYT